MDALYALIEAILKITTNHNETFVSEVEVNVEKTDEV